MERAYWVAWSSIKAVGPVLIKRLQDRFGSLQAAWQVSVSELLSVDGIGLSLADQIGRVRSQLQPQQLLDQYEARQANFWTPADRDYPVLLRQIADPPPVLYYRGPLRPNSRPGIIVSVVGTRRPSDYGRRWTQCLSACLGRHQITVVSGMAAGVDTYAHKSCLDHSGPTIAVLGTGIDVVYPSHNHRLYGRLLETGLILSEYPNGTAPHRGHFPRRNRIIAGLSHVTLVTEAPERSGALITAYLANDYGRDVYALPGGLDSPQSKGCLQLASRGAALVLGEESLLQMLTERFGSLPTQIERLTTPSSPGTEIAPALASLLTQIPHSPTSLDRLIQLTQLDTATLLSQLSQLEIVGLVTCLPGSQYQRL